MFYKPTFVEVALQIDVGDDSILTVGLIFATVREEICVSAQVRGSESYNDNKTNNK